MRKIKTLLFYLLLIIILVTGCKKDKVETGVVENNVETTIVPTPTERPEPTNVQVPEESFVSSIVNSMTPESYPIVDGSTATIPLSEAVYRLATGATELEAQSAIVHTKTSNSYYRLMSGEVDLLIVYEPSEEVLDYMKENKHNLKMKPIGKDALVFMTNASNPVQTLTHEQLVQIYTGKITNWSEVGGDNIEIRAFQRPPNSGSQTLMQKLVMREDTMAKGPNVSYYDTMEGILEAMADYSNEGNTLGYSVFYYAQNMYQLPELRFMKVKEIEPSLKTIYDNSYPYVNEFYAVIREDEVKSSNAHLIFDWLTGEEGQTLVKNLGYVPVSMDLNGDSVDHANRINSKLPDGYRYITASYTTSSEVNIGTVTVYDKNWEKTRVFQNTFGVRAIGLIPEETIMPIGYAIFEEDGSNSIRYGLYSVKEDKFILPVKYEAMRVLDQERGYYYVSIAGENQVIDRRGNVLVSGFLVDEWLGVTKKGEYFWINDYSSQMSEAITYIYDKDFVLINNHTVDYTGSNMYEEDGTLFFSREMFIEKLGLTDNENETLYSVGYREGDILFSVMYKDSYYVLDKHLNTIAKKKKNDIYYNGYDIIYDIYLDREYDPVNNIQKGIFYDKNGVKITDIRGNTYSNNVNANNWDWNETNDTRRVIYRVEGNVLSIIRYYDGQNIVIDLGDWSNIEVNYVFGDVVIINNKEEDNKKTRVYNKRTLMHELEGWYTLSYLNGGSTSESILLENIGYFRECYNVIINHNGDILYQSAFPEEIINFDRHFIQINRGNYTGVIDYEGQYIIRSIRNELSND